MTCILKSCAHGSLGACKTLAKSGLAECGAAYALELASRNDGYMVHAHGNPMIDALRKAGKISTKTVPGTEARYLIARAIQPPSQPYHHARHDAREAGTNKFARAAQIGRGVNIEEEASA